MRKLKYDFKMGTQVGAGEVYELTYLFMELRTGRLTPPPT